MPEGIVQAKEEKLAKRAKLASKSKLSFADDEEEDEVGLSKTMYFGHQCT